MGAMLFKYLFRYLVKVAAPCSLHGNAVVNVHVMEDGRTFFVVEHGSPVRAGSSALREALGFGGVRAAI